MKANNEFTEKYENSFLKQEVDYLTNFQHESSNFYGFPKILKSKLFPKLSKSNVLNTFHISNEKI